MEAVLITYSFTMFLISLHLIDVQLDDRHSISLLQIIVLRLLGAKGIYYKDWLSFTPVSLIGAGDFFMRWSHLEYFGGLLNQFQNLKEAASLYLGPL